VAAEFGDETPVRLECTTHSGDDLGLIAHPVQRRVAEHSVEFAIEIESFPARHTDVQAEFSCGVDLLSARIDTDDMASHRGELRGKHAVAAAKVQDALAGARREQINHGRAKFGDEAGVACIAFRIPGLRVCHFGGPRRAAADYQLFLFSAFGNSAFSSVTPDKLAVGSDSALAFDSGRFTSHPEVETDGRGGATMSLQGRNTPKQVKSRMPRISHEELLSRLTKGKPIPALLLLGDEPFLRDASRAQLIETFVPEAARPWAVSRYSADRNETQDALEQAQTLPMLAPRQIVFLHEVEKIEKLGEKNRDAAVDQLEAYLDNPAPFTILVLEATALDQRMKLAKLLSEKSLVVDVGLGEDLQARQAAAVPLARAMAKDQGVEFEKGAAEDLAEFVAADLMRLKTEIDKLATYVAQRKLIRRQDVVALVISEKTTTVWELADMLATRQGKRALEFLDCLLREGEEPLQMLGAITWMYRKLIEASELKGVANSYQAARALAMRPEQAELALRSARKIPKARLLQGLQSLQAADSRLKGGAEDPHAVMEFLISDLAAPAAKSASR